MKKPPAPIAFKDLKKRVFTRSKRLKNLVVEVGVETAREQEKSDRAHTARLNQSNIFEIVVKTG